jgi:hypothetical protein
MGQSRVCDSRNSGPCRKLNKFCSQSNIPIRAGDHCWIEMSVTAKRMIPKSPEKILMGIPVEGHFGLQFKIRPKKCARMPFHRCLALSNTKPTGPHWNAHNRGSLVVATMLYAIKIAELVNIETGVKRLYRHDEVDKLEPMW